MKVGTGDMSKGFSWMCPRCLVSYVVDYTSKGTPKCLDCRPGKSIRRGHFIQTAVGVKA